MKKCKPFETKLVAYLHGELDETKTQALENHLETCESCRAELEAQRTTLELLGEALESAPAPERLAAWRNLPHRVSVHRPTFSDYWYSPRLRVALVTGAAFSVLFCISISFVALKSIKEKGQYFDAGVELVDAGWSLVGQPRQHVHDAFADIGRVFALAGWRTGSGHVAVPGLDGELAEAAIEDLLRPHGAHGTAVGRQLGHGALTSLHHTLLLLPFVELDHRRRRHFAGAGAAQTGGR